jgi:hypothetical protein
MNFLVILFLVSCCTLSGVLAGMSMNEGEIRMERTKVLALTDSYYKLKELCVRQEKYYLKRLHGRGKK